MDYVCELLGMSANTPTDLVFSFSGLMQRGGKSADHNDGWGLCFYSGKGIRYFHDSSPASESRVADFLKSHPIRSHTSIAHIRKANRGKVNQSNTHPFIREMWGEYWTLAHNGQLKGIRNWDLGSYYKPVGTTDSEKLFCYLLGKIRRRYSNRPKDRKSLFDLLQKYLDECHNYGIMNLLFSDGQFLYVYCSTKLHYITRKSPFGIAELKDIDCAIDFSKVTTPKDIVSVIATSPLTKNESWTKLNKGDFVIFKSGKVVYANWKEK